MALESTRRAGLALPGRRAQAPVDRPPRPLWFSARALRRHARRLFALIAAIAVLAAGIVWQSWDDAVDYRVEERMIAGASGVDGDEPARLDTALYVPDTATAQAPAPAVLLAHGFGADKHSVADTAGELAGHGYVVLAYTARGFGRSNGKIHLNHPKYEVADARRLIGWLSRRPEVRRDAADDPRVAVTGASYGGALALSLAGRDRRVDAIVPQATWHDLADVFLPEATGAGPTQGVFTRAWAGLFFGAASGQPMGAGGLLPGAAESPATPSPATPSSDTQSGGAWSPDTRSGGPLGGQGQRNPACGRFADDVCRAYLAIAAGGSSDKSAVALLRRSSPASTLGAVTAPTLLIQGLADTLFPLSEADANARGITGAPVRVAWFSGGHDGRASTADDDRVKHLTLQWLDHHLRGVGGAPGSSFTYSRVTGIDPASRGLATSGFVTGRYPGLDGNRAPRRIRLAGAPQLIANPPDGNPAAVSSLPGVGGLAARASGLARDLPGQHARYVSAPLPAGLEVTGSPRVRIRAASPTGEAVLFVKLYDLSPSSGAALPNGLVAPVRLTGLPASIDDARPVTVTLPAIVHRFEAGHRLALVIASADQAYATPSEPTVYTVGLGGPRVSLPRVASEPLADPVTVLRWVLVGVVAALALGVVGAVIVGRRRLRRQDRSLVAEHADVPLVVRGLRKEYADGFVAVSKVGFTVERGQVVGLLGPNGAGKTTTLRALLGLIQPTAGEALVFGCRLAPGAPVLSRLGSLVEGPGFLPHLSGLANLQLYWRATGRPWEDARFDEVLAIAGLGDAVHRKVSAYSHGMKQRVAIAQAMLGLPELLVLDEPTDGLDPPQIAEMRRVLHDYARGAAGAVAPDGAVKGQGVKGQAVKGQAPDGGAAESVAPAGRAVLVSSHLLAEVEQTCTHVVVMHRGALVASGPVEEIVGDSPTVLFDVSDVDGAERALVGVAGVSSVRRDGGRLLVDLNGTPRRDAVAALVNAGVGVERVIPRRRLEDAFLTLVSDGANGIGPADDVSDDLSGSAGKSAGDEAGVVARGRP